MNRRFSALLGATAAVVGLAGPTVAQLDSGASAVSAGKTSHASKPSGLTPTSCRKHARPTFVTNGVTAHRGYSAAYPENTMTSLRQGIAAGADWIELDVFISADGKVVVNHDTTTGRTGDKNLVIADSTWAQLKRVDVAYGFRTKHDLTTEEVPVERMPLLSEALQMVACQGQTRVSIQPKTIAAVDAAVEVVHELGVGEWVGFNDGSLPGMSRVKELDPSLYVFWDTSATADIAQSVETALDRGFETIVMNEATVSPQTIATIQDAGLEVGAWTINDLQTIKQFDDWGIDRVYTDHAAEALSLVTEDTRKGLARGLTGYWPMDDAAGHHDRGVPSTDETATRNPLRDGALVGNAEISRKPRTGRVGRAVSLDGWHDHVHVKAGVLPDVVTPYTASIWFKPTRSVVADRRALLETTGSWAISMELAAQTGHLKYSVETDGQSVIAESDITASAGKWHHASVTYDPATGDTRLYFDGREVTTFVDAKEVATGRLAATTGLRIGSYRGGDGRYFEGALDEVAVWTRLLDAKDIKRLWADGKGTPIVG